MPVFCSRPVHAWDFGTYYFIFSKARVDLNAIAWIFPQFPLNNTLTHLLSFSLLFNNYVAISTENLNARKCQLALRCTQTHWKFNVMPGNSKALMSFKSILYWHKNA